MAIGDVKSDERGSGARLNDGKPRLSLVPVRFWRATWSRFPGYTDEIDRVVQWLQETQEGAREPYPFQVYALMDGLAVLEYGVIKYAAWNWTKGMPWSVCIDCALRHIRAIVERREDLDPESGESHLAHALCNVMFLSWFMEHYPEGEDLIPPAAFAEAQGAKSSAEMVREFSYAA